MRFVVKKIAVRSQLSAFSNEADSVVGYWFLVVGSAQTSVGINKGASPGSDAHVGVHPIFGAEIRVFEISS